MNALAEHITHQYRSPRAVRGTLPRLSRPAGFWAVAFSFLVVSAFATTPSGLYGLYEHHERQPTRHPWPESTSRRSATPSSPSPGEHHGGGEHDTPPRQHPDQHRRG
jgi:hypothetical protein